MMDGWARGSAGGRHSVQPSDREFVPAGGEAQWPVHVLQGAPALITYIDRQRRFRFVNDTHQAWVGLDPRRVVGRRVEDVLDPWSLQQAGACLEQALAGSPSVYEGELFSGKARCYVHGNFQPDFDDHGQVRGVFTVFIDLTERHALETQLRESEQRFYGAFQHAPIGMALVTVDGHMLRVNDALCQMLGYDEQELLARAEGTYDLRLFQRVVLQPRAELNFAAQDTPETRTGSGLSNAELGLRLRYEIRREFAPYIGVSWDRRLGKTADYVRAAGESPHATTFVVVLRTWF